jgi:hypothetical protein
MGLTTLPAAAIPRGAVVRLVDGREVTVRAVYNADPRPGYVRWITGPGTESVVAAAVPVEVVSLP